MIVNNQRNRSNTKVQTFSIKWIVVRNKPDAITMMAAMTARKEKMRIRARRFCSTMNREDSHFQEMDIRWQLRRCRR
jgi:GMP synthase PP-ATPase subunit